MAVLPPPSTATFFPIDKSDFEINGFTSLDLSIDYDMKAVIPCGELQGKANALVSDLSQGKLNSPVGKTIDVAIKLTGTVTDPKVKTQLGDMVDDVKEEIKDKVMDEIASLTPIYGGISFDRIDEEGLQWPCLDKKHPGTKYLHERGKFTCGLGRFHAIEHKPPAEEPDSEYPFILTTGRMLFHYNVGTMSRRTPALDRDWVRQRPAPTSLCRTSDAHPRGARARAGLTSLRRWLPWCSPGP